MILQHLILPSTECGDFRLYTDRDVGGFPVDLQPGESIAFRGFMNAFSLTKWRKYTDIGALKLSLQCTGRYSVTLLTDCEQSVSFECEEESKIEVTDRFSKGLLSIRITAITQTSVLSGSYMIDEEPKPVRLALDVCTYRRPEYIEKKKKETFLKALEYDGFSDNAELFIIDNAGELDTDSTNEKIHIFQNTNTGGSGGISRGIEEIHRAGGFTHIALMDDDTELEPECLYRTWSFLSYLKEEYRGSAIGGTMLLSDKPCMLYESGAVFEDPGDGIPRCRSLKHKLDVSADEGCEEFDEEERIDYNGWWYCVYPSSFACPDNLPMRLFMRYDDVEYGLRFGKGFITLNGISVWHPDYSGRKDPVTLYYSIRNHLILLREKGVDVKKYERKKMKDALSMVKNGDRASASAIADAVRDSRCFDSDNNDGIFIPRTYGRMSLLLRLFPGLF